MSEIIEKFIGLHFKVGVCNLKCSYCYVGQHGNKMLDIPFSLDDIKKAFSRKRLGGTCFINICSDGETLIHPDMPKIIELFLEEGHYVLVVTNGILKNRIKECISISKNVERLFFKISFHYEDMKCRNVLDVFWENLEMIKSSPCSYTVEYITCDETLNKIDEFKSLCIQKMGCLPQLNMPRDERTCNLGVLSKDSLNNYYKKWDDADFDSEFWEFRKQFFGKKYKDFCYAGLRTLWINMENGYSYQCYHLPPLQNFMGELNKPVKWLAVGNNCPEAHCYVAYSHMTLGNIDYPDYAEYRPTYDTIRNRVCLDGSEWIKPTYKNAFQQGVRQVEFSETKKMIINKLNILLKWLRRKGKEL